MYHEKNGIKYSWLGEKDKLMKDEFLVSVTERNMQTGKEFHCRLVILNGDGHVARRLLEYFNEISVKWSYRLVD